MKNFHESGSVSLIDHFKDGKQHGDFKTFHENGEISMKGQFFEGKKLVIGLSFMMMDRYIGN